ncbi:MAG: hypothetical protein LUC37_03045 [Prevotella sp.]|nr:hypothetical protein [Prevotella sp.]
MYYNPQLFGILPYKHKYTATGEEALTSFFVPAFKIIKDKSILDKRGWCTEEKGREYYDKTRAIKESDPEEYLNYTSQYCYNAEEGFSLQGDNKFNKILITNQLTNIRALKVGPRPERGFLEYTYKGGVHSPENINGFKWIENKNSNLQILEHPIWLLKERRDEDGKVIWTPPSEKIHNLYVIGIDGIDISQRQTSSTTKNASDFCCVVYKRSYGIGEP